MMPGRTGRIQPTTMVLQQRAHTASDAHFQARRSIAARREVVAGSAIGLESVSRWMRRGIGSGSRNGWSIRRSPTTARAIVNRIWQDYFGQGLVTTPEDFGTRVGTPSHPELLDWLACELMDHRGNLENRMTKLETDSKPGPNADWCNETVEHETHPPADCQSATYRQSSRVTPEDVCEGSIQSPARARAALARRRRSRAGHRALRRAACSIRRSAVRAFIRRFPPAWATPLTADSIGPKPKGADRYRRGMYTFSKRSVPFPCSGGVRRAERRDFLSAPGALQHPVAGADDVERKDLRRSRAGDGLARHEGRRRTMTAPSHVMRSDSAPAASRRRPKWTNLLKFWEEQYRLFRRSHRGGGARCSARSEAVPPDVNLHKVAAWTMVSRAMLNLDETITKE